MNQSDRVFDVSPRIFSLLIPVFVSFLLVACTPVPPTVVPPAAPAGAAGLTVFAPADTLALSRPDLAAGFELASEKRLGAEYAALYLRPIALDTAASGGNALLSVLTSVGVYTTTADAESAYAAASNDPDQQGAQEIAPTSASASDIVIEPFAGAPTGTDGAEAFRVSYQLMGQSVFEYGFRFRLGNVLAYVVVSAVGTPDEPLHLAEDARDLVQRQIDSIVDASELLPQQVK